jgi:uncharacterized HAD superfamily protein
VINGAVDGVNYLKKKHNLFLITSRPNITKRSTLCWLDRYFPIVFDQIILSNQFSIEAGKKKTKGEIGVEVGIDAMIDDHIDYVVDCMNHGIKSYLFEATWNKQIVVSSEIVRMRGWVDVKSYF